eukprot:566925-Rhodomonas_salina.1
MEVVCFCPSSLLSSFPSPSLPSFPPLLSSPLLSSLPSPLPSLPSPLLSPLFTLSSPLSPLPSLSLSLPLPPSSAARHGWLPGRWCVRRRRCSAWSPSSTSSPSTLTLSAASSSSSTTSSYAPTHPSYAIPGTHLR